MIPQITMYLRFGTIMHHNLQLHPPELTQSPQLFRFVVFAKVLDFAKCILHRKFKNICIIPCWWLAAAARWVCAGQSCQKTFSEFHCARFLKPIQALIGYDLRG